MITTLSLQELAVYLQLQFNSYFPDNKDLNNEVLLILPKVLQRLETCFKGINKRYYRIGDEVYFNHLNSDHYCSFLYFLSNEAFNNQLIYLAEKSFYLNKVMNGIDVFYSVILPKIFLFVHPLGTVLGNAEYSDHLVVYQNVTVGSDVGGVYPKIGEACVFYSKSTILGNSDIKNNVTFSANSFDKNASISSNQVVLGSYPSTKIIPNKNSNKFIFFDDN